MLAAARCARAALPEHLPAVLFVTDPKRVSDPLATVARLPAGWGVIYRHFGAPDRREQAAQLKDICCARGLIFIVAADPQLARLVAADGVHWPARLRRDAARWRRHFTLMSTSHHPGRDRAPSPAIFDFALVSTVFTSQSPSASPPMGSAAYRLGARELPLPTYALGGVNASNAESVTGSGGMASIDGIVSAFGRRSEAES